jgi:hypothetical protein
MRLSRRRICWLGAFSRRALDRVGGLADGVSFGVCADVGPIESV